MNSRPDNTGSDKGHQNEAQGAAGAAHRTAPHEIHIGLMSGTSMDGVDGVLMTFDDQGRPQHTLATASLPMPDGLRSRLAGLQHPGHDELARAALAANELADLYADCVAALLDDSGIEAHLVRSIGAHGQTIRHAPADGYSLQILNGARLAARTGIDVVADLRSADIAAGGQGAPLMPAFHAHVFQDLPARCGILNLGGIANLSVIDNSSSPAKVIGFDTGPANVLLDGWIERHQQLRYDHDGAWAASGTVIPALLARLLGEPWFALPAPKSTGRDLFHLGWLDAHLAKLSSGSTGASASAAPEDVQATLLALTVETTAAAIRAHRLDAVYVCGGGALNRHLMQQLQQAIGPATPVRSTQELGIAPLAVEASGFAWLAWQRIHQRPVALMQITGARHDTISGALHLAPPR
ncbi:MAG: anhydro-N-acetylmuramic acid kinase [Lautropia sp.]|nr:anhydro-N-acetylmuramic acid kinase [Lautropia sp.]